MQQTHSSSSSSSSSRFFSPCYPMSYLCGEKISLSITFPAPASYWSVPGQHRARAFHLCSTVTTNTSRVVRVAARAPTPDLGAIRRHSRFHHSEARSRNDLRTILLKLICSSGKEETDTLRAKVDYEGTSVVDYDDVVGGDGERNVKSQAPLLASKATAFKRNPCE